MHPIPTTTPPDLDRAISRVVERIDRLWELLADADDSDTERLTWVLMVRVHEELKDTATQLQDAIEALELVQAVARSGQEDMFVGAVTAPDDASRGKEATLASDLIDRGALFVVNHSGGKDSQAMIILLDRLVPRDQLLVVHAPLGEVEWPGTIEHIRETIPKGVPLVLAPVASGKSLLERIEERGQFPDPARRWCTSDFKRGPIEREIRRHLKANPRFRGRVVNCMGMRAEESSSRAKLATWSRSSRNSKAGRDWYDWLPIHGMTTEQVFESIRAAGQSPHWAYAAGMTRLSCSFCIMASRGDHRTAAGLRPALYRKYVALERRLNHTLSPSRQFLPELTGVPA